MAVMYVVAANAEQPGIPRPLVDRPRRFAITAEPVGPQHAAPDGMGDAPPPRALCGADLRGWIVFSDRRFEPRGRASCQRCAQLVSTAMPRSSADIGSSAGSDRDLPAALGRRVRAHSLDGVVILAAAGRLSDLVDEMDQGARLALAGEPRAVVCDVTRAEELGAPGALRRLALNGRHPRDWPGCPVAVAGLDRARGDALRRKPLGSHLVVTTSLGRALAMVLRAGPLDATSLRLSPHPTAPRASRDFVSRTLLDWGLSRHLPSACLVVSELVTNAMTHAGTDIHLTLSEHRQALRVAVRDQSAGMPAQQREALKTHGRGLAIVAGLATAWGVLPHPDGGKVVWAVIDASARATERHQRPR